jgi:hypothetical protein
MQNQNMNLKLNVKDISKGTLQMQFFLMMQRNNIFWQNHVSVKLLEISLSVSCLDFSRMFSGEKSSFP